MLPVDFVFDYETLGVAPVGVIVELSYVPFVDDPRNPPNFMDLVASGRKYKFAVKPQTSGSYNRPVDPGTVEWWKKQSAEARSILKPSDEDFDLYEGHEQFLRDLKEDGISVRESMDYCRGQDFDRAILVNIVRGMRGYNDIFHDLPTRFWNGRDVRTAIENRLLSRGVTVTPLPRGTLDGFIKHDSIHDCAKDVLMLVYALRYAYGIQDAPEGDEIDPLSIQK